MSLFIEVLETIMKYIVEISTVCLEIAGIIVLVSSAVICFVKWVRRDRENIRLDLAMGIALALEFKMGGEVLRTVVVREWGELLILGSIIILRAALTFLIHWEIENEKKEMRNASKSREQGHRGRRPRHRNTGKKNTDKRPEEPADRQTENADSSLEAQSNAEPDDMHEENFRRPSLSSDPE
jgi:uncharacterized membrane protein